jgi:hypothetical protein
MEETPRKVNPEWLEAPYDVAFHTVNGPSVESQFEAARQLRKNPDWVEAPMEMGVNGSPSFVKSMREWVDNVNRRWRMK